MVNRQTLLSDLQKLLVRLEADLLERSESSDVPEVGRTLRAEYERAKSAERTAQNYEDWRSDGITQAAAAWVLSCVFVRFLEDNRLIDPPKIAGPPGAAGDGRLERARDEYELYFRVHPKETDREYLLAVFDELAKLPGTKDVFGEHNPVRELPNWLSGDAAGELLGFFQKIDANTGALVHDFSDPNWDTRFLGDLYQDLSKAARKKYALLQTPEFVEKFILDRTLNPALDEFGLTPGSDLANGHQPTTETLFRMIDPACGSGHFLLGSFHRILDRWQRLEPATKVRELVQRALNSIYGVDVNPYAVAIARFRLLLAAMRACDINHLDKNVPGFKINLACGDSLLHGAGEQQSFGWRDVDHVSQAEDIDALRRILRAGNYHVVVANPPYITPKDSALNQAYRDRYSTCHRQYSLAVPFMQRLFQLAIRGDRNGHPAGYTGQITTNTFMKREFGKKLIEQYLITLDLTHVVDSQLAHVPGHGIPHVILFGRNRSPTASTVRLVAGLKRENEEPIDPARGLVWTAILDQVDRPDSLSDFVSVSDTPREQFCRHPWSIGGGGAAELKEQIDECAVQELAEVTSSIGFFQDTHADEAFVMPQEFANRHAVRYAFRDQVRGDDIRDWNSYSDERIFFPYTLDLEQWAEVPRIPVWAWLHNLKTVLWSRSTFGGGTYRVAGRPWFDYHQFPRDRARTPLSIAFAFVATHNQFVMDRGGNVFNRSAPVIKLSADATEDDHLSIVGLLNSSTAAFWLRQVCHDKGGGGIGGGIAAEAWERFLEYTGTKLEQFPLPEDRPLLVVKVIDDVARQWAEAAPAAILERAIPTSAESSRKAETWRRIRCELIDLQESLDWLCYKLYGLIDEDLSYPTSVGTPPVVQLGERAFEIVLARKMAAGEVQTTWFERHGSTPITELPEHWPDDYKKVVERRIKAIETNPNIALIEQPEYKRRWNTEPWQSQLERALREWLLARLESYFDFDGRMNDAGKPTAKLDIALCSVAKLADIARQDAEFQQVGELYRNDAAFDVQALVAELVAAESVPLLPVLRYKPSGLRKRAEWEKTWELQRREDAGEDVGTIDVPPKYTSADFISTGGARYWSLRGKLDVPKERWISFPHCEGPDGTPVICWAGYDHLQQAKAISAYYVRVQTEFGGTDDARLIPLLACLIELLPWLKQWHNEPDASYDGLSMGDYFEGFVNEEARQLNKTIPEIKAWAPPARASGRRRTTAS